MVANEYKIKTNVEEAFDNQWKKMGDYLEILSHENESLEQDLHNGKVRRLKRQADEYKSNENKPEQILAAIHVKQRHSVDENFIDMKKKVSQLSSDYKTLKKDLNQVLVELNSLKSHRNQIETRFLTKNRLAF